MLATRYGAMRQKLSIIYIKPDQIFPILPFSVNGNSNFDSFLSLIPHFQTNSKFYYSYLQTIFRTWKLHITSTANNLVQVTIFLAQIITMVSKSISLILPLPVQLLVHIPARITLLTYVMLSFLSTQTL